MFARLFILTIALGLAADLCPGAAPWPRLTDDQGDPLPDGAVARLGTLRRRPGVTLEDLAWSPDGKWLASADGSFCTVRLWDAKSGRVVRTFWGHRDNVRVVAFSPDSKRLLSGSDDGTARIWDVATGKELLQLPVANTVLRGGTFSRDGKTVTLVAASSLRTKGKMRLTGSVVRLNASTGAELSRFELGRRFYALSPRGDRVATPTDIGKRSALVVRDVASGKTVVEFVTPASPVGMAFSPDGKLLAVQAGNATLSVFDVATGNRLSTLSTRLPNRALKIAFSPDGKRVLGEVGEGQLRVWDVATGKELVEFPGYHPRVQARAFSPDGKKLATQATVAHECMPLRIWDAEKGTLLSGKDGNYGVVKALAFSPDGKHLLAAGSGPIRLFDVKTRQVVRELPMPGKDREMLVYGVAFSRDGKQAAAVSQNSPAIVWDVASGKVLHSLNLPSKTICHTVTFSADGDVLFVAGYTKGVHRWNLKTGKELDFLRADKANGITGLTLSKDGKTLTASGHGQVLTFDVDKSTLQRTIELESDAWRTSPSPDGKQVASSTHPGQISIRNAADGKRVRTWQGETVWSLSYSPDGKYLVGNFLRVLRMWETKSGKALPPIVGDAEFLWAWSFSPDGRWLATAGTAGTVLLWDTSKIGRPSAYRATEAEWNSLWEMAGSEGGSAWYDWKSFYLAQSLAILHACGDRTVTRIRERLFPPAVDVRRFERLIKGLGDEDEDVKKRSAKGLIQMGEGIVPLLDKILKGQFDADVRLRLVVVRSRLAKDDPSEQARRAPRIVSVLKRIGTPKAQALLADLASDKAGRVWADAAK